jgi:hypothetical protein
MKLKTTLKTNVLHTNCGPANPGWRALLPRWREGVLPTPARAHFLPRLTPSLVARRGRTGLGLCRADARFAFYLFLLVVAAGLGTGCQVLTYRGPNGEQFTRSSLGSAIAISALTVESGSNGVRRVEMQGYQNDSTQALGSITEAAVRAALQNAR